MTERAAAERIVRELHRARVNGDLAGMCSLFADDGRFEIAGASADKPIAIRAQGLAEFKPWLAMMTKVFRLSDYHLISLVIEGAAGRRALAREHFLQGHGCDRADRARRSHGALKRSHPHLQRVLRSPLTAVRSSLKTERELRRIPRGRPELRGIELVALLGTTRGPACVLPARNARAAARHRRRCLSSGSRIANRNPSRPAPD